MRARKQLPLFLPPLSLSLSTSPSSYMRVYVPSPATIVPVPFLFNS